MLRALTLLAAAALVLTACNGRPGGAQAGNRLCKPFASQTATTASLPGGGDPAAPVDDCLHRWGYALAGSSDPANVVAGAVVAACTPALSRWNQAALGPQQGGSNTAPEQAPSLLTGEPTTPMAERYGFAQNRALFYVVQARAGKCPPRPMTDGAPSADTKR
jgi:hypothetical protein